MKPNKETIRTVIQIIMLNDWTPLTKLNTILKENGIKSMLIDDCYNNKYERGIIVHHREDTARATYNKETNETTIVIVKVYKQQCIYCSNGNCTLENICCDGYGKCAKEWLSDD